MKNKTLEEIKAYVANMFKLYYGYCGVMDSPDLVIINSGSEIENLTVTLRIGASPGGLFPVRGVWIACADEMPVEDDTYFTASGNKGTGWAVFRDGNFGELPDITHWLKLHPVPTFKYENNTKSQGS